MVYQTRVHLKASTYDTTIKTTTYYFQVILLDIANAYKAANIKVQDESAENPCSEHGMVLAKRINFS